MRSLRKSPAVVAVALLAALTAGCLLGPNYRRPPLETPAHWRDGDPVAADDVVADTASLANTAWWELFQDPVLQKVIREALERNQDLKIAVERIAEARARLGFVRADLFPRVNLTTDVSRFEQSREAFPNNPPPAANDATLYGLSLDVLWEIDLFGRIRRATEAERSLLLATEEARRAVAISLIATVATAYIEMRSADEQLAISRRTLELRGESLELTRLRFRGGLTSEKDPMQAEAEYRRIEATVFQFEQRVRLAENALSVLLGRTPGPVERGRPLPDLPVALSVPAGLPSELLDRRPDLRAAEEQLHAATADVGAAKALLFPRIALTAGYGTASTEFDALFTGSSQAWSVAAGLVQPIFNSGKNLRRVDIAEAKMRQFLYAYEKAVLEALREVEDGLIVWCKSGEARNAQRLRVAAEQRGVELSNIRYEGGVTSYLEVLDAQRSLFAAQLDEVQSMSEQVVAFIQLYKALGGGWPTGPTLPAETDDPDEIASLSTPGYPRSGKPGHHGGPRHH